MTPRDRGEYFEEYFVLTIIVKLSYFREFLRIMKHIFQYSACLRGSEEGVQTLQKLFFRRGFGKLKMFDFTHFTTLFDFFILISKFKQNMERKLSIRHVVVIGFSSS